MVLVGVQRAMAEEYPDAVISYGDGDPTIMHIDSGPTVVLCGDTFTAIGPDGIELSVTIPSGPVPPLESASPWQGCRSDQSAQ